MQRMEEFLLKMRFILLFIPISYVQAQVEYEQVALTYFVNNIFFQRYPDLEINMYDIIFQVNPPKIE